MPPVKNKRNTQPSEANERGPARQRKAAMKPKKTSERRTRIRRAVTTTTAPSPPTVMKTCPGNLFVQAPSSTSTADWIARASCSRKTSLAFTSFSKSSADDLQTAVWAPLCIKMLSLENDGSCDETLHGTPQNVLYIPRALDPSRALPLLREETLTQMQRKPYTHLESECRTRILKHVQQDLSKMEFFDGSTELLHSTLTGVNHRVYQKKPLREMLTALENYGTCFLTAPCATGKTIMSLLACWHILLRRWGPMHAGRILVIVPCATQQWVDAARQVFPFLSVFLLQEKKKVNEYNKILQSGLSPTSTTDADTKPPKRKRNNSSKNEKRDLPEIVIASAHTLVSQFDNIPQEYFEFVIIDEVHSMCCDTLSQILRLVRTYYLILMSATPTRWNRATDILTWFLGEKNTPVTFVRPPQAFQSSGAIIEFAHKWTEELSYKLFQNRRMDGRVCSVFQSVFFSGYVLRNTFRQEAILNRIMHLRQTYGPVLVSCNLLDELNFLVETLRERCPQWRVEALHGKVQQSQRLFDSSTDVMVATYGTVSEAVSYNFLTAMLRLDGKQSTIQPWGRIRRTYADKNEIRAEYWVDVLDQGGFLSDFEKEKISKANEKLRRTARLQEKFMLATYAEGDGLQCSTVEHYQCSSETPLSLKCVYTRAGKQCDGGDSNEQPYSTATQKSMSDYYSSHMEYNSGEDNTGVDKADEYNSGEDSSGSLKDFIVDDSDSDKDKDSDEESDEDGNKMVSRKHKRKCALSSGGLQNGGRNQPAETVPLHSIISPDLIAEESSTRSDSNPGTGCKGVDNQGGGEVKGAPEYEEKRKEKDEEKPTEEQIAMVETCQKEDSVSTSESSTAEWVRQILKELLKYGPSLNTFWKWLQYNQLYGCPTQLSFQKKMHTRHTKVRVDKAPLNWDLTSTLVRSPQESMWVMEIAGPVMHEERTRHSRTGGVYSPSQVIRNGIAQHMLMFGHAPNADLFSGSHHFVQLSVVACFAHPKSHVRKAKGKVYKEMSVIPPDEKTKKSDIDEKSETEDTTPEKDSSETPEYQLIKKDKGIAHKQKPDADNILKFYADMLATAKCFSDDKVIDCMQSQKVWSPLTTPFLERVILVLHSRTSP
jgi:Holliday junction resolvase RusA-like endonuclease